MLFLSLIVIYNIKKQLENYKHRVKKTLIQGHFVTMMYHTDEGPDPKPTTVCAMAR